MALIESVTDQAAIGRIRLRSSFGGQALARLGLPNEPASFAPPRDPDESPSSDPRRPTPRGPPWTASPRAADPSPPDDRRGPPWLDDCQLLLDDDASQVPPDAQD
jgi:hypothetical protein